MTGTVTKDRILRADFNLWDGITLSTTRKDSTGGTLTGNKVGNTVDVLEVYGSGTAFTAASINAAITAIGTNRAMLSLAPGTWTIDAAVTIPTNITLFVPHGVILSVSAGVTLTINGHLFAGIYKIFTNAGTIVGFSRNREVYPEWWGAVGDGVTNDTTAIQDAINAISGTGGALTGGVVSFLPVAYKVTALTLKEDVHLVGVGGIGDETSDGTWLIGTTGSSVITFEVINSGSCTNTVIDGVSISGGDNCLVSNNQTVWFHLRNVRFSGPVEACISTRGFIQQWFFDTVDLQSGKYGWRHQNLTGTGSPAANNLIDKSSFVNLRVGGQSESGIFLEFPTANNLRWASLFTDNCTKYGFYADGGASFWTFEGVSNEQNHKNGQKVITTGSITSGTNTLTVASGVGIANGDTITIRGAAANGRDLETTVSSGGGTVNIVTAANASNTVTSLDVTNALYDNFRFNNTIGTAARVTFIGFEGDTGVASDNVRYDINLTGGSDFVFIGSSLSQRGIYDPGQDFTFIGSTGEHKLPLLETVANYRSTTLPRRGKASNIPSTEGGNLVLALVDSAANGSGTYGDIQFRKFNAARNRIGGINGTTGLFDCAHRIRPGAFGNSTGATLDIGSRGIAFGNAVPTAGTWNTGDVILKETPVVAQPIGWTCTVGGTPGTWVAWANL